VGAVTLPEVGDRFARGQNLGVVDGATPTIVDEDVVHEPGSPHAMRRQIEREGDTAGDDARIRLRPHDAKANGTVKGSMLVRSVIVDGQRRCFAIPVMFGPTAKGTAMQTPTHVLSRNGAFPLRGTRMDVLSPQGRPAGRVQPQLSLQRQWSAC